MKCSTRCLLALAFLSFATTVSAQQPALQVDWVQSPTSGTWYGVDFTLRNWTDSNALAVGLGGTLGTVRDSTEQTWIEQSPTLLARASKMLYLGGSDQVTEGTWAWSSGAPWTYTNWGPGEPTNDPQEDYLSMARQHTWIPFGKWNDEYAVSPVNHALFEFSSKPRVGWSWPRIVPTGIRPSHGCLVDLDGDGDLDYASPDAEEYVTDPNNPDSVSLHWNNGAGNFTPTAPLVVPAEPTQLIAVDWDQDGDQDLAFACYWGGALGILENQGGAWAPYTIIDSGGKFEGLAAGDLNGDGIEDLLTTKDDGVGNQLVVLFLGQTGGGGVPGGSYSLGAVQIGNSLEVVDLDGDGDLDFGVARHQNDRVQFFINDGVGGFSPGGFLSTGSNPNDPHATDLDGDGDLDFVVPCLWSDVVQTWANDGLGGFSLAGSYACGQQPAHATSADLDGDGDFDVVVTSIISDDVRVFWNDGLGALASFDLFQGHDYAIHGAVGDLNGDAVPDLLAVGSLASSFAVWINGRANVDCNGNGVPDTQDIADGTSADCDGNEIPDECDIANDPSLDWNGDGVLDDCSSPNYCAANTNTTGQSAVMSVSGSPLLVDNAFTMTGSQMPAFEWGYFLMSPSQGFIPNVGGSSGNLCLASPFYRFNKVPTGQVLNSQAGGTFSFTADLNNLPQGVVFQIGETWNFQAWFRDGFGNTSNFTDGIAVMFR